MSSPKVKIGQVWEVLGVRVTIEHFSIVNGFAGQWGAFFFSKGRLQFFELNNDWTPYTDWTLIQDVPDEG